MTRVPFEILLGSEHSKEVTGVKLRLRARSLVAIPALALSCNINQVGPCVHTYREPVLTIQRAIDASGNGVATVLLDSLSLDGRPLGPPFGLVTIEPAFRITADSSVLTCSLPCGFGTEPGRYEFRTFAPGYARQGSRLMRSMARFTGAAPLGMTTAPERLCHCGAHSIAA